MNLNDVDMYSKAVAYATKAHEGQIRKISGISKIVRPYEVSVILLQSGYPIELAIAGLLHDVIEDCKGYSIEDIEREFGKDVAGYVSDVTELDKSFSWKDRKNAYIDNIKNKSEFSKALSCADKIDNLLSLHNDIHTIGISVFEKFNAPREEVIWFYEAVYNAITNNGKIKTDISKLYRDVLDLILKDIQ